jgi:hypothetical protein
MEQETLPRHALPPEPLRRFIANQVNREKLKAILREPAFIAAMNFLQEQNRIGLPELNSLPDMVVIRRTSYLSGVAGVYERLQELTKLTDAPEEVEAWDHIQPTEP